MALSDRIKLVWDALSPKAKQKVVFFTVMGIIVIVATSAYWVRKGSVPAPKVVPGKKDEVSMDPKLLEKSMYMEGQKEIAKRDEKIAELSRQIDDIVNEKKAKDEQGNPEKGSDQAVPQGEKGTGKNAANGNRLPDLPLPPPPRGYSARATGGGSTAGYGTVPPPPGVAVPVPGQSGQAGTVPAKPAVETFGEIELVSHDLKAGKDGKGDGDKDKKKDPADRIYLPPSFMAATLLSGLDAPTSEGAKGNPAPVFIRIKDLAVLPNRVKANLKGCFVIAEGHGNLATERAELRLVSLSCLDRKDNAIIDQKIKGFVVDSDGKIGLKGTVVSKMGASIARSLVAGFFGGIGDAFKMSSATQAVSALGVTQIVDPNQVVRAGVGGGISTAATELQKFYLELAKQTMPVVEVGATKNITLVISEGIELDIKDGKLGRRKSNDEI
jgi:conjugal transfer pilus assembly protein TraB